MKSINQTIKQSQTMNRNKTKKREKAEEKKYSSRTIKWRLIQTIITIILTITSTTALVPTI